MTAPAHAQPQVLPVVSRQVDDLTATVQARSWAHTWAITGPQQAESAVLETDIDEPAAEILAEADRWGADLIVMGTHWRHGLAHLILGSVAEGVVQRSNVPVLLLRASDDAPQAS